MKTAVEYIKEKLMCDEYWYKNLTFDQIFEKAKEMEKEQIVEGFNFGVYDGGGLIKKYKMSGEQYYNQTFKQ
jgi:hypothetical protein